MVWVSLTELRTLDHREDSIEENAFQLEATAGAQRSEASRQLDGRHLRHYSILRHLWSDDFHCKTFYLLLAQIFCEVT